MRTFAKESTARETLANCGDGLPRHKFESVQLAFLTKEDPGMALSKISEIKGIAPS